MSFIVWHVDIRKVGKSGFLRNQKVMKISVTHMSLFSLQITVGWDTKDHNL